MNKNEVYYFIYKHRNIPIVKTHVDNRLEIYKYYQQHFIDLVHPTKYNDKSSIYKIISDNNI